MWAPWMKLLCILILVSLLTITTADAKIKSKKNKKPPKDDSQGKSSSEESLSESSSDVNPKMKPLQNKPGKKNVDKKVQDDPQNIPVLKSDVPDVKVQQEKLDPPEVRILATSFHSSQTNNCSAGSVKSDPIADIEKNVSALWAQVNAISNPVHIHVHGGRVSSPSHHRHYGYHDQEKDKLKNWDKNKGQGHHHCQMCSHSPSKKQHGIKVGDHSSKSHSHGNESSSHGGHDKTSHDHSSVGHGHGHGGHNVSHRDHSYKRHHDYKGHGHSPSKFRDHRQGHHFGDGRGHSTHVHIHVSIDEKRGHTSQSPPSHWHSHNTTIAPANEDALYARCDIRTFDPNSKLSGYVLLRQKSGSLDVKINITGFVVEPPVDPASASPEQALNVDEESRKRNLRGLHVHQFGDFSEGCASFGPHFNPQHVQHGGLEHSVRHVGDWGNVEVNDEGEAISYFSVNDSTLRGQHSILGRGIVVHGQEDDLGEGDTVASHSTGNAGARLGCCIITQIKPQPDEIWQASPPEQDADPVSDVTTEPPRSGS